MKTEFMDNNDNVLLKMEISISLNVKNITQFLMVSYLQAHFPESHEETCMIQQDIQPKPS